MKLIGEHIRKDFIRKGHGTNVLPVLKETDLTLSPGELTVLTGRSGSGKSTLLNILSGLLVPTEGRVLYGETDLYALTDEDRSVLRNREFGYIPQGHSAVRSLTVLENILLPLTLYGDVSGAERAEHLMRRMGIAALSDVMPNELSGGELRRMAIARALIRAPKIVFADEPTGDLDDENTGIVLSLLKETAEQGAAVFLVTHENMPKGYADRSLGMSDGTVTEL